MYGITFLLDKPTSTEKSISNVDIPFFLSTVSCGFPSPAEDYIETPLDLNELLITKPAATFFVKAKGDSMTGAGIFDGDLLIIDRSITARNNNIVLAVLNSDFTLKRYSNISNKIILHPESLKYKPIEVTDCMEFTIWGVAIACIHKLT